MQSKLNQAITLHPLFFDPVNKKALLIKKNGKEFVGYQEDRPGIIVTKDNEVIFSMYAPDAQSVEVSGVGGSMGKDRIVLEKDAEGYYTKKVSGIAPGFHYHDWYVDGVQVRNPIAPFCYGCFGAKNFFELPEPGQDFWFIKDVPHGDVQLHKYVSSVNGHMKSCYIYTPPTYQQGNKNYPVLYIMHGVGENETGWIWNGKLNFIMDNLIAEGKCREMIVVSCCNYAFCEGEQAVFYPGDFDSELTKDCIGYTDTHFRTISDRKHRAVAGLSLGSAQALLAAANHPDLFGALGIFSGVRTDEMKRLIVQNKEWPMERVFLGCGNGETELKEKQEKFLADCEEAGVPVTHKTYTGYHEWHVWRECLRDFAQLIFKNPEEDICTGSADNNQKVEWKEQVMSVEMLDQQTWREDMLFFDPIYKGLVFEVDQLGQPAGRYVDVAPGQRVTAPGTAVFRIPAKGARKVEVDLWGVGKYELIPETGDASTSEFWVGEVTGIEPGFHYYTCQVNGTTVVNPDAPAGYGGFRVVNFLEMPEEDRLSQVPHGTVHMQYYKSERTGRWKLCYVYTPPKYDENPEKRYPVLYLQHGGGEDEMGWLWQGKIAHIADNLLAKNEMKDMIIVMNTGYSFPEEGEYHPGFGAFLEEFPESGIGIIDRSFRTIPDREHRAMAGLSMGGMQTQKIVFKHPELFSAAGIFSGGLVVQDEEDDYRDVLLDKEKFKERFVLLFVACGTKEPFYEKTRENADRVLEAGVPIETFWDYGYHDWTFWRHCAVRFLRQLFV